MQRTLFLVILIVTLPSAAASTTISARIIDFGIYYTRVDGTIEAPELTSGEINLLTEPVHVRSTTTIPALRKSSFGLRYQIEGLLDDKPVEVVDVIITPGLKNPDSEAPVVYRESRRDVAREGKIIFTGYTFDESWEAVPGDWTIEVWMGHLKLVSKQFTVVKAKPLRH